MIEYKETKTFLSPEHQSDVSHTYTYFKLEK